MYDWRKKKKKPRFDSGASSSFEQRVARYRFVELPPVLLFGVVVFDDPEPLVPDPVVSSFFI